MFKFEAYSKNNADKLKEASLRIIEKDGVSAVYADKVKRSAFNPEEAISVKFNFNFENG